MLSSLMNGMTGGLGYVGGDDDLGGGGYLGEWHPYLEEFVGGGFGGLPADHPPLAPIAPVAPVSPIAVDPMCRWCMYPRARVGK